MFSMDFLQYFFQTELKYWFPWLIASMAVGGVFARTKFHFITSPILGGMITIYIFNLVRGAFSAYGNLFDIVYSLCIAAIFFGLPNFIGFLPYTFLLRKLENKKAYYALLIGYPILLLFTLSLISHLAQNFLFSYIESQVPPSSSITNPG